MYINEIVRINYKCNWKCKFCNISKVNNYGTTDIKSLKVVNEIVNISKKYKKEELSKLNLSLSGGEPTLNKNLLKYVNLSKKLGIGSIQLQTNGTMLFKNYKLLNELINAGVNDIFLAQHSHLDDINKKLGCYYNVDDFVNWVNYIKNENLNKKVRFLLNIVVTKINIFTLIEYLDFLQKLKLFDVFEPILSIGLVQPHGYAKINADDILLKYTKEQVEIMDYVVKYSEKNKLMLIFHYTCPPLCIIDYPEYNLEYQNMIQIEKDKEGQNLIEENFKEFSRVRDEKQKFSLCTKCKYNKYCKGHYKHRVEYVGENYALTQINDFLNK